MVAAAVKVSGVRQAHLSEDSNHSRRNMVLISPDPLPAQDIQYETIARIGCNSRARHLQAADCKSSVFRCRLRRRRFAYRNLTLQIRQMMISGRCSPLLEFLCSPYSRMDTTTKIEPLTMKFKSR